MHSFDPNTEMGLTETAYQFTAGVLKNARGFTAVCNPLVNSYKRLVPGYEAPCYIAWSGKNRSPLIRVPSSRGLSTVSKYVQCIQLQTHTWR